MASTWVVPYDEAQDKRFWQKYPSFARQSPGVSWDRDPWFLGHFLGPTRALETPVVCGSPPRFPLASLSRPPSLAPGSGASRVRGLCVSRCSPGDFLGAVVLTEPAPSAPAAGGSEDAAAQTLRAPGGRFLLSGTGYRSGGRRAQPAGPRGLGRVCPCAGQTGCGGCACLGVGDSTRPRVRVRFRTSRKRPSRGEDGDTRLSRLTGHGRGCGGEGVGRQSPARGDPGFLTALSSDPQPRGAGSRGLCLLQTRPVEAARPAPWWTPMSLGFFSFSCPR